MKKTYAGWLSLLVSLACTPGCSCQNPGASFGERDARATQGIDAGTYSGPPGVDAGNVVRRDAGQSCSAIAAVVRDFDVTHPDFEADNTELVTGLVMDMLDAEHKPQFAHGGVRTGGIDSADSFREWYRDVAGINQRFEISLPLTEETQGHFVYDNPFFFPIDGLGFGNSGLDRMDRERNFHFTTEIHTSFVYEGGETFTFRGDDDLWLFIDGRLAIDLGGTHRAIEDTVHLDELGLTVGVRYSMDIFHAERHTRASNFRIETTIACFMDPILI